MAFNTQEQEIVKWGLANGKTKEEVSTAISNYRLNLTPKDILPPEEPGYFETVGSKLKSNAEDITSSVKTALTPPEVVKGNIGQTAKNILGRGFIDVPRAALRTVGGVASAITTPIFNAPGIKQAIGAIGYSLSKIPGAKWLGENLGKLAAEHPEIAKDLTNVGDILAVSGMGKIPFMQKTVTQVGKDIVSLPGNVVKGVGDTVNAVKNVVSPATEYAKSRFPKLLGIFSGENNDVITQAMKNPELALQGAKQGDVALRNAIKEGAETSIKLKNKFITDYAAAKTKVLGQYGYTLAPKTQVKGIFNNILKEYGVDIKNGVLDFTKSKIVANSGEMANIQKAYKALNKWGQFNVSSLDDYKQLVGQLTKFAKEAGGSSKSPSLGKLYYQLNDLAASNLPKDVAAKYLSLNSNFSKYIATFDDIVDAFNSGDPFSRFANALGKNKDSLDQLLEFYSKAGGKKILPIVAGREIAMEKSAAFGFLNPRSWIDLLLSPQKQAEIVIKAGGKLPK